MSLVFHGETKLQIFAKDKNGDIVPPYRDHLVYRVVLRGSGETWAIDLTGKQFGYSDLVYNWDEFDRCGWTICDVFSADSKSWIDLHKEVNERRELSDDIEKIIPSLAKKFGGEKGNLSAILKGSDAAFKEVKRKILEEVEDIVKRYIWSIIVRRKRRRRETLR